MILSLNSNLTWNHTPVLVPSPPWNNPLLVHLLAPPPAEPVVAVVSSDGIAQKLVPGGVHGRQFSEALVPHETNLVAVLKIKQS